MHQYNEGVVDASTTVAVSRVGGGAALVALLVHQHTSTVLSAAFNEWVGSVGVFFQLVSPTTT